MIPYVLYVDEHYNRFVEQRYLSGTNIKAIDLFRLFLKEIGTSSLLFTRPLPDCESVYHQVPSSTCIRLRSPEDYSITVKTLLYQKQDKPERSTSCSIV